MIKVCIDPMCDEVAHNIEKTETHCRSCNGLLVEITASEYRKKFVNYFFQYDYATGNLVTPDTMGFSVQLIMNF